MDMRRLPAAILVAVLVTACSGEREVEGVQEVRAVVDAQADSQEALRVRVVELEDALAAVTDDDAVEQAMAELGNRMDGLQGNLDQLGARLEEEAQVRAEGDANAAAGAADLTNQVGELREQVTTLQRRLAQLRTEFDTLRDLFDQHVAQDQ